MAEQIFIMVACFTLLIVAWYQLFVSAICCYQLFVCWVCRIVSSAAQQHWMSLNCALVVERFPFYCFTCSATDRWHGFRLPPTLCCTYLIHSHWLYSKIDTLYSNIIQQIFIIQWYLLFSTIWLFNTIDHWTFAECSANWEEWAVFVEATAAVLDLPCYRNGLATISKWITYHGHNIWTGVMFADK